MAIVFAVLLVMAVFLVALQYINVVNIARRDVWKILGLIVIAGAVLAYFVDPPQEWDLYRHFEEIDRIASHREWGIAYESNYHALPSTMALFTVVSYLPSVHFLPAIAIAIIGFIILFVLKDYSESFEADNNQWIIVAFFCSVAYMNIVMSVSGVRNTLAAAVGSLGVYLGVRHKKRLLALVLGLIAAGFHPQGVILPIVYVINWLLSKLHIKGRWMALLVFPAIMWALELIRGVDIPYLQYILDIADSYSSIEVVVDGRIVVLQTAAMLLFLLTVKGVEKNKNFEKVPGMEYFQMVKMYLFAVLGSLGDDLLFYRMLYPVGILMIPQFCCMFAGIKSKNKRLCLLFFLTALWGGLLLYNFVELYGALF